jgi:hypothetical protein
LILRAADEKGSSASHRVLIQGDAEAAKSGDRGSKEAKSVINQHRSNWLPACNMIAEVPK